VLIDYNLKTVTINQPVVVAINYKTHTVCTLCTIALITAVPLYGCMKWVCVWVPKSLGRCLWWGRWRRGLVFILGFLRGEGPLWVRSGHQLDLEW